MDYFIADPHFGHANIIKYCHRPFANANVMDQRLIHRWNDMVRPNDTVYLLGDIWTPEKLKHLKGNIVVVMGNHDKQDNLRSHIAQYVDYVSDYPIFVNGCWLSHEPIEFMPPECPYLNIHGHLHIHSYGIPGLWRDGRRHFCCSVEQINYEPISMERVLHLLEFSDAFHDFTAVRG